MKLASRFAELPGRSGALPTFLFFFSFFPVYFSTQIRFRFLYFVNIFSVFVPVSRDGTELSVNPAGGCRISGEERQRYLFTALRNHTAQHFNSLFSSAAAFTFNYSPPLIDSPGQRTLPVGLQPQTPHEQQRFIL